jgi:hypothetical protein
MREYFTYGSVRGAAGNGGPYRVRSRSQLTQSEHFFLTEVDSSRRAPTKLHGDV